MKSEVKKLDKSEVEITVEVSAAELRPYLEKAAAKISQEIKIEGFRPGKAPYEIVKQKVGEMDIMKEAIDEVITKTYYVVLEEQKIMTIGQPKIDIDKLAPGNPFVYRAVAAVLPAVKIGDWKKITLRRQPVEISVEQIDKVMTDIRQMRATEKLVDRAAQVGDKLEIDFAVFLDKVPLEHGRQQKYPIVIGENKFIPGFEEQLVGMTAGQEKEFELKFPEKYHQEKLAGKPAEFKVKCLSVWEVVLPELNDEFIKSISAGKFNGLAEVKKNIRENLELEEKQKQEQRLEAEMFDRLVEQSEFEPLPEVLLDYEVDKMINELRQSVEQQGFDFADYLKSLKKNEEELKREFRPAAEKRVKASIISREIYQRQQFEVRPDEVEKEIEEIMNNYPANPEARKQFTSETYRDYLRNLIGNRQVVEFLKKEIISD